MTRTHLRTATCASESWGIHTPYEIMKEAWNKGISAVGITDYDSITAFSDVCDASAKLKIEYEKLLANGERVSPPPKVIYGITASLVDDVDDRINVILDADEDIPLYGDYVVIDFEASGINVEKDHIVLLEGIRYLNGVETGRFMEYINPPIPISEKIEALTGISSSKLARSRTIEEVLPDFVQFCKGAYLVSRNVGLVFDLLSAAAKRCGVQFDSRSCVDLDIVFYFLFPDKMARTEIICESLGIEYSETFQESGASLESRIYSKMLDMLSQEKISKLGQLKGINSSLNVNQRKRTSRITIWIRNNTGWKNLSHLMNLSSSGYVDYLNRPVVLKSKLAEFRQGLLLGSNDASGQVVKAIEMGSSRERIKRLASFYDYLEVQSPDYYEASCFEESISGTGAYTTKQARDLISCVIDLGNALNIPVVYSEITSLLGEEDLAVRQVMRSEQGENINGFFESYNDCIKSTDYLINAFSFLGAEKAKEIICTNPDRISKMTANISETIIHQIPSIEILD